MNQSVIAVEVKAVVPAAEGRAVFIGNDEKAFVIYVDRSVGDAITMFISGQAKMRPLTHDLIGLLLDAMGASVERVVINHLEESTYFARLIISAENEVMHRKIVEIDARPSDCMAIALQQNAPLYVAKDVWDAVEDMSGILNTMQQGTYEPPDAEIDSDEDDDEEFELDEDLDDDEDS